MFLFAKKYLIPLFVAIVLHFLSANVYAQHFERVIDAGPIVTDSLFGIGTAWGDYNNDGNVDLLVTQLGAQLYKNNGDGTFDRISDSPVENVGGIIGSGTWGDYNNDGYLDLYLSRYGLVDNNGVYAEGVPDIVYMNSGPPSYSLEQINLNIDSSSSTSGGWADVDNDGWLDLFIPRRIGNSLFFSNNRDGSFTELSDLSIVDKAYGGANENWIDYDNDGDQDLFMSMRHGTSNELFKNMLKESGRRFHFVKVDTTQITNEGSVFDINSSWGDYDNDGDFDVFIPNNTGAPHLLYRNDGDGKFTRLTDGPIVNMSETAASGTWGDYDNDGDLDLYVIVGNPGFIKPVLFNNNGDGNFERAVESEVGDILMSMPSPQGGSWCDYDNDGDLDAYVITFATGGFNGTKHPNYLFKNNLGNQNNYLIIECVGDISNYSSLGTKVHVKANINGEGIWQTRYVTTRGISGVNAQDDFRLHFGLGDAQLIDSIKIEWPSRIIQVLEDVQPNQILCIDETMPEGFLDLNFYADSLIGESSLTVNFSADVFTDPNFSITNIEWDLNGDGVFESSGERPSYLYESDIEADYDVTLKVSNGFDTKELKREGYIKLSGLIPNIQFDESQLNLGDIPQDSGNVEIILEIENLGKASDSVFVTVEFNSDPTGEVLTVFNPTFEIIPSEKKNINLTLNSTLLEPKFIPYTSKALVSLKRNPEKKEFQKNIRFRIVAPTGVELLDDEIPKTYSLNQNYPNPFNPESLIRFSIPHQAQATLKVYNSLGAEVASLLDAELSPGNYEVNFDGSNFASGVYFYRLSSSEFTSTKKMLLLK